MKEQNIAKIYAESFIQIGKETNIDVADEMTKLTEVINVSNQLENVLFLDVFTVEEKTSVFTAIAEKIGLSQILVSAVKFLIEEKRIGLLPLIFKEIIIFDDNEKGFLRGVIEGSSDSISDAHKEKVMKAIQPYIGNKKAVLDYKKSENVTAGFRVKVEDLQLDATIDNQLKHFKEAIIGE